MKDRIKLLPESVANQIAAGEVVNRPSSVIKELLENAVDAGAKNITVNFRDGGKQLIQVIDDGCGMSENDARLAFDRHATSKIDKVEDIYNLATFGFRGEALASIASVAEVELRTRRRDADLGTQVEISGGKYCGQIAVNCSVGTQLVIKNLFYNVPARRRFLEKSSTESRHIIAECQRVALCNPQIAFNIYDNDSLVYNLPAGSLRQRIVGLIGKNIGKNLLEVSAKTTIVSIDGFTGRPSGAKQNNKEQFLFVNGRYFKSPYFHKAVLSAYEKLIPTNTQPSYFIFLTVDPANIDVNVHPQKTEVKFEEGPQIWQIINAAVRESLAKSGAVPAMDFELDTTVEIPVYKEKMYVNEPRIQADPTFNPFVKYASADEQNPKTVSRASDYPGYKDGTVDFAGVWEEVDDEESVLEFIEGVDEIQSHLDFGHKTSGAGFLQAGTKYAVTATEEGLKIYDIRRIREAVLFDKYLVMLSSGNSASQQLLFPETEIMSLEDAELAKERSAELNSLGFEFNFSDEFHINITGIPSDISLSDAVPSLYEVLDILREETGDAQEKKKREMAAALARRGASPEKKRLEPDELERLLDSLERCADSSFTPGGLPVAVNVRFEEIEKKLEK